MLGIIILVFSRYFMVGYLESWELCLQRNYFAHRVRLDCHYGTMQVPKPYHIVLFLEVEGYRAQETTETVIANWHSFGLKLRRGRPRRGKEHDYRHEQHHHNYNHHNGNYHHCKDRKVTKDKQTFSLANRRNDTQKRTYLSICTSIYPSILLSILYLSIYIYIYICIYRNSHICCRAPASSDAKPRASSDKS